MDKARRASRENAAATSAATTAAAGLKKQKNVWKNSALISRLKRSRALNSLQEANNQGSGDFRGRHERLGKGLKDHDHNQPRSRAATGFVMISSSATPMRARRTAEAVLQAYRQALRRGSP